MKYSINNLLTAFAMAGSLSALAACNVNKPEERFNYPKGFTESDPAFVRALSQRELPDVTDLAIDIKKAEPQSEPRGEFETTPEYEVRLKKERLGPYGAGVYAVADTADFFYDADTGKIGFHPGDTRDDMLKLQQLQIEPIGPAPDKDVWEARIGRDKAKSLPRIGDEASVLRRVIVFSLEGLERPVLNAPEDPEALRATFVANAGKPEGEEAIKRLAAMTITIKAHITHAFVYDPAEGPGHPLYDWRPR